MFYRSELGNILGMRMTQLSQSGASERPARLNLVRSTTVVLHFPGGHQVHGRLQVISVTGGLLCLSNPLNQGFHAKLMFRAQTGPGFRNSRNADSDFSHAVTIPVR